MSQGNSSDGSDNFILENQTGLEFRTELNSMLDAIKTTNSGTAPPPYAVEGTVWYNLDTNKIEMVTSGTGATATSAPVDTNTQRTNTEINSLIAGGITGKANSSHTHAASATTTGIFDVRQLGSGPASGEVLTASGAAGSASWQAASGGLGGIEVFTGNGTWIRPSGVTTVWVTVVGAGGGGGGRFGSGEGGGGGAGNTRFYSEVTVNANVAVVVGTGGPGGNSVSSTKDTNNTIGTAGGPSSFAASGGTVTSGGGGAGSQTSNDSGGGGGGGNGNGTGGSRGDKNSSGSGGSSFLGSGGSGSAVNGAVSNPGAGFGAGGSGGNQAGGGRGSGGVVIVYY